MAEITVGRVTVRSDARSAARAGAPALRLRAERALAAADLAPPGLPPAAVLVIRRLAGAARQGGPPGRAGATLRREVAALYREAARPVAGPAPSQAAAVLFEDEAELLACLTRDALAGQVGQRWYWREFAGHAPASSGAALASAWAGAAKALPRALAQLRLEEAVAATGLLSPGEVAAVGRSLEWAYAAAGPGAAVAQSAVAQSATADAPWRPWLPAPLGATLAPPAERLLGMGLALARAPAYARSPAFATRADAWLRRAPVAGRAGQAGHAEPPATSDCSPGAPVIPRHRSTPAGTPPQAMDRAAEAPLQIPAPVLSAATRSAPDPEPPPPLLSTSTGREPLPEAEVRPSSPHAPLPVAQAPPEPEPRVAAEPTAAEPVVGEPVTAAAPASAAAGVSTELAGAFFLLNLLSYLDLPHGWTEGGQRDEELSAWALLEALARGLLGQDHDRYGDDPLWAALAALDGRAAGEPLRTGLGGAGSHLPAAWLRKVGWAAGQGERGYSRARLARSAARAMDPATAAWLRGVLPFIRHLLARAMGLTGGAERRAAAALMIRPGRLQATNTHVDLYLPMDSVSLPVRRAGLDADPGWVPDLGRIVRFHYG